MKNNFFEINSVAVIGATEKQWKVGSDLVKNLENFEGKKYWVNPNWGWEKWIKFYKEIKELPEIPDIAIIVIPAKFVLQSLEELGIFWVKRVIIISAGFKEVWDIEEENKIIELGKKYGMRILWPNCLGYIDTHKNLNLSFGGGQINSWNIALISQSGAMAVALTDMALSTSIGFSKIISMWNKSDVDENDLLLELENDEDTKVIVMYLESIVKGRKFYEICSRITQKKPIVLVKSGTSQRWWSAASSHTWALSWENEVLQVAFREAWIIVTSSLEELFMFWQALSKSLPCQYLDLASPNKTLTKPLSWILTPSQEQGATCTIIPQSLAIITNAGWPWVMATDWTEEYWINMADFSKEEKESLMKWMPGAASVSNPIDIIWDARSDRYKQILENLSQFPEKNSILIMLTPQKSTDVEEIAKVIVEFEQKNPDMFVMTSFMWWEWVKAWKKILQENNILSFDFPQKALKVFSILASPLLTSPQGRGTEQNAALLSPLGGKSPEGHRGKFLEDLKKKLQQESKICSAELIWEILKRFWINYINEKLIAHPQPLPCKEGGRDVSLKNLNFWDNINYIAKISSPDIAHKTDVWGIVFNIKDQKQAENAYNTIIKNVLEKQPKAHISWVTFARQLNRSTFKEIFIWLKRDPSFWDILVVGLGGIYVNIFEDVQVAIAPVSKSRIIELFKSLKSTPLLEWARGEKWVDFELLANEVYKLQTLFASLPEIKEIDINPLFSNHKESVIVDAKFYV